MKGDSGFKNWIIREENSWLAINKRSGFIVERNPFESPTVEELGWSYLHHQVKKPFLGIVHRLDRPTSGLLILAKKKSALKHLNLQFANRQVQKSYFAITDNRPPTDAGVLEHWLLKDQKNKIARISTEKLAEAQKVQLAYELMERKENLFLLNIQPRTGKFHQIRAQLAAMDCPIVGDEKYGSSFDPQHRHIGLHAHTLTFLRPDNDQQITLKAPIPEGRWWKYFANIST